MGIRVASITHPGQSGKINQDAVYAKTWILKDIEVGIIAVADGMGGYSSGDRAANIAIDVLNKWCCAIFDNDMGNAQDLFDSLDNVFLLAHNMIKSANIENGESSGTTLTVCLRVGQQYVVKNTGDTRCFLLAGNNIERLSTDDSWIAEQLRNGLMGESEALTHPKQNLLTKCLGLGIYEAPHSLTALLKYKQILCVCSDGFYKHIKENELNEILSAWRIENKNPLEMIMPTLFCRGETDNISIALMS